MQYAAPKNGTSSLMCNMFWFKSSSNSLNKCNLTPNISFNYCAHPIFWVRKQITIVHARLFYDSLPPRKDTCNAIIEKLKQTYP